MEIKKITDLLQDEDIQGFKDSLLLYLRATQKIGNKISTYEGMHPSGFIPWGFSNIQKNLTKLTWDEFRQFATILGDYLSIEDETFTYSTGHNSYRHRESYLKCKSQIFRDYLGSIKLPEAYLQIPDETTVIDAIGYFVLSTLVESGKPVVSLSACLDLLSAKVKNPLWLNVVRQVIKDEDQDLTSVVKSMFKGLYVLDELAYQSNGSFPIEQYVVVDIDYVPVLKKSLPESKHLADVIERSFADIKELKDASREEKSLSILLPHIKKATNNAGGVRPIDPKDLPEKDCLQMLIDKGLLKSSADNKLISAMGKTYDADFAPLLDEAERKQKELIEGWLKSLVKIPRDVKAAKEKVVSTVKIGEEEREKRIEPAEPKTHSNGINFIVGWECDKKLEQVQNWSDCDAHHNNDKAIIWWPGNNGLVVNMNIAIAGDMGTGKTQLTKNLVYQTIQHSNLNYEGFPVGFIIFDYKGDYSSQKDTDFAAKTNLTIFEPHEEPIPINIFEINTQKKKQVLSRFNSLWDILSKVYGNLGPKQKADLKKAVISAYEFCGINDKDTSTYLNTPPTIYDVYERYKEASKGEDSLSSILADIVDNQLFSEDPDKCIKIEDLFSKITSIKLDSLGNQIELKDLIVTVFLDIIYDHMLHMGDGHLFGDHQKYREVRTFILVDEADNILAKEFEFMKNLLKEGRSFGFGVILSTQYLSHYQTTNIKYYEYFRTWFIHQIPTLQENDLKKTGFPQHLANDIKTLPKFHAFFKGDLLAPYHNKIIKIKDESFFTVVNKEMRKETRDTSQTR